MAFPNGVPDAPCNPWRSSMAHLLRYLIPTALAAGALAFAWHWNQAQPMEVRVAEVGTGLVEKRVANTRAGAVRGLRRQAGAQHCGGQIAALPVREGRHARTGRPVTGTLEPGSAGPGDAGGTGSGRRPGTADGPVNRRPRPGGKRTGRPASRPRAARPRPWTGPSPRPIPASRNARRPRPPPGSIRPSWAWPRPS